MQFRVADILDLEPEAVCAAVAESADGTAGQEHEHLPTESQCDSKARDGSRNGVRKYFKDRVVFPGRLIIFTFMKKHNYLIPSAVLAVTLALTGCSEQSAEHSDRTQPAATDSANGPAQQPQPVNDRFTGTVGDFTIRVTNLQDPSNIVEVEMPDHESRKQVAVTADVTNNGNREIDLACSLELDAKIFSDSWGWGNVGYLERVPGNPACGDLLKPGETKQMTWVALINSERQPNYLNVEDTAHPDDYLQLRVR